MTGYPRNQIRRTAIAKACVGIELAISNGALLDFGASRLLARPPDSRWRPAMDGGLSTVPKAHVPLVALHGRALGPVTAAEARHGAGGVQGAHVRAHGCASSRRPRLRGRDEWYRVIPEGSRGGGARGERGAGGRGRPPAGSGRRPEHDEVGSRSLRTGRLVPTHELARSLCPAPRKHPVDRPVPVTRRSRSPGVIPEVPALRMT